MTKKNTQSIFMGIVLLLLLATETFAKNGAPQKPGARLSLDEYLSQVGQRHMGYKAADQTAKAALDYSGEGSLIYKPTLLANAVESADARNNPRQKGPYLASQKYTLGISEQTPFGLSGTLSYNHLGTQSPGAPTLGQPATAYETGYAQIELNQSLFRNWFGIETRSQAQAIESAAKAKSFLQSFAAKTLLLEAETAYWRLVLSRETVETQRDAVDRARKIFDWTNRRLKMALTDQTELYQASSNLRARELDLQAALDEERAAALGFNSSRGVLSDKVEEKLNELSPELLAKLDVPNRNGSRDDVAAAEYQAKAAAANSLLSREKNKPTLEVYGSALLTQPAEPSPSVSATLPLTARPQTSIGVRLVAPLDVATLYRAAQGHNAEAQAASWTHQRKVFESEREWQDVVSRFRESKTRIKLFTDLERIQREKADFEREKQQRGRSTMQQVLMFETDYQSAQLGRIRTFAELLTLTAQMKLFGGTNESR